MIHSSYFVQQYINKIISADLSNVNDRQHFRRAVITVDDMIKLNKMIVGETIE